MRRRPVLHLDDEEEKGDRQLPAETPSTSTVVRRRVRAPGRIGRTPAVADESNERVPLGSRKRGSSARVVGDAMLETPIEDDTFARLAAICTSSAHASANLDAEGELYALLHTTGGTRPRGRISARDDVAVAMDIEHDIRTNLPPGHGGGLDDEDGDEDEDTDVPPYALEENREDFWRLLASHELAERADLQRAMLLFVMTRPAGTRRLSTIEELKQFAERKSEYLDNPATVHFLNALLAVPTVDQTLASSVCSKLDAEAVIATLNMPAASLGEYESKEIWFVHPDPRVSQPLVSASPVLIPKGLSGAELEKYVDAFVNAWAFSVSECAVFPHLKIAAILPCARTLGAGQTMASDTRVSSNHLSFSTMTEFCTAFRVLHSFNADPLDVNNTACFSYRWPFVRVDVTRPFPPQTGNAVKVAVGRLVSNRRRGDDADADAGPANVLDTGADTATLQEEVSSATEAVDAWLRMEWGYAIGRMDLRSEQFTSNVYNEDLLRRFLRIQLSTEAVSRDPLIPGAIARMETASLFHDSDKPAHWHEGPRVVFRCAICDVPCWMFWVKPMRNHVWYCGATWCKQLGPLSLHHEGVLKSVLQKQTQESDYSQFQLCCVLPPVHLPRSLDPSEFVSRVYGATMRANSYDLLFQFIHGDLSIQSITHSAVFRVCNLTAAPSAITAHNVAMEMDGQLSPLAIALERAERKFTDNGIEEGEVRSVIPDPQRELAGITSMPSFQPHTGVMIAPSMPMDLENVVTHEQDSSLSAVHAMETDQMQVQVAETNVVSEIVSISPPGTPPPADAMLHPEVPDTELSFPVERDVLRRVPIDMARLHLEQRAGLLRNHEREWDEHFNQTFSSVIPDFVSRDSLRAMAFGSRERLVLGWTALLQTWTHRSHTKGLRDFLLAKREKYACAIRSLVDKLIVAAPFDSRSQRESKDSQDDNRALYSLMAMRATSDLREWASLVFSDPRVLALNNMEVPSDRLTHATRVLTACYKELQTVVNLHWARFRANYQIPGPRAQVIALLHSRGESKILTTEDGFVAFLRGWRTASRHMRDYYTRSQSRNALETMRSNINVTAINVDASLDPLLAIPRRANLNVSTARQFLSHMERFMRQCEVDVVSQLSVFRAAVQTIPVPAALSRFTRSSKRRRENVDRLVKSFAETWRLFHAQWVKAWPSLERTYATGAVAGDADDEYVPREAWKDLIDKLRANKEWFVVPGASSGFLVTEKTTNALVGPTNATYLAERAWIRAERLLSTGATPLSGTPAKSAVVYGTWTRADALLMDLYLFGGADITQTDEEQTLGASYIGRPQLWKLAVTDGPPRLVPSSNPGGAGDVDFYDLRVFDPNLVETADDALALCRELGNHASVDGIPASHQRYLPFHSMGIPALTDAHCRYMVAQSVICLLSAMHKTPMNVPVPMVDLDAGRKPVYALFACQPSVGMCTTAIGAVDGSATSQQRVHLAKALSASIGTHILKGRDVRPVEPDLTTDMQTIFAYVAAYEGGKMAPQTANGRRLHFFEAFGISELKDAQRLLSIGSVLFRSDDMWNMRLLADVSPPVANPDVKRLLARHAACARVVDGTADVSVKDIKTLVPEQTIRSLMETVLWRTFIIEDVVKSATRRRDRRMAIVPLVPERDDDLLRRAQEVRQDATRRFISDTHRETAPFARHVGLLVQALGEEGIGEWHRTIGPAIVREFVRLNPMPSYAQHPPDRQQHMRREWLRGVADGAVDSVASSDVRTSIQLLLQTMPSASGSYAEHLRAVVSEVNVGDRIRAQLSGSDLDVSGTAVRFGERTARIKQLIDSHWIPQILLDLTAHSIATRSTRFAIDVIRWAVGNDQELCSTYNEYSVQRDSVRMPWLINAREPFPTSFVSASSSKKDQLTRDARRRTDAFRLFVKELPVSFWMDTSVHTGHGSVSHWLDDKLRHARILHDKPTGPVYVPKTQEWSNYVREKAKPDAPRPRRVVIPRVMYDDVVSVLLNRPLLMDVSDDKNRRLELQAISTASEPWRPMRRGGFDDADLPEGCPWLRTKWMRGLSVESVTYQRLLRGGMMDVTSLLSYLENVCTPCIDLSHIDVFGSEESERVRLLWEQQLAELMQSADVEARLFGRLTRIDTKCSLPFGVVRGVLAGRACHGLGSFRFGDHRYVCNDTVVQTEGFATSPLEVFGKATIAYVASLRDNTLLAQQPGGERDTPWFDSRRRCENQLIHDVLKTLVDLPLTRRLSEGDVVELSHYLISLSSMRVATGMDRIEGVLPSDVVAVIKACITESMNRADNTSVGDVWKSILPRVTRLDAVPPYTYSDVKHVLNANVPKCSVDDRKAIWAHLRMLTTRRVAAYLSYVPDEKHVAGSVVHAMEHFLQTGVVVWPRVWSDIGRGANLEYQVDELLCDVFPVTVSTNELARIAGVSESDRDGIDALDNLLSELHRHSIHQYERALTFNANRMQVKDPHMVPFLLPWSDIDSVKQWDVNNEALPLKPDDTFYERTSQTVESCLGLLCGLFWRQMNELARTRTLTEDWVLYKGSDQHMVIERIGAIEHALNVLMPDTSVVNEPVDTNVALTRIMDTARLLCTSKVPVVPTVSCLEAIQASLNQIKLTMAAEPSLFESTIHWKRAWLRAHERIDCTDQRESCLHTGAADGNLLDPDHIPTAIECIDGLVTRAAQAASIPGVANAEWFRALSVDASMFVAVAAEYTHRDEREDERRVDAYVDGMDALVAHRLDQSIRSALDLDSGHDRRETWVQTLERTQPRAYMQSTVDEPMDIDDRCEHCLFASGRARLRVWSHIFNLSNQLRNEHGVTSELSAAHVQLMALHSRRRRALYIDHVVRSAYRSVSFAEGDGPQARLDTLCRLYNAAVAYSNERVDPSTEDVKEKAETSEVIRAVSHVLRTLRLRVEESGCSATVTTSLHRIITDRITSLLRGDVLPIAQLSQDYAGWDQTRRVIRKLAHVSGLDRPDSYKELQPYAGFFVDACARLGQDLGAQFANALRTLPEDRRRVVPYQPILAVAYLSGNMFHNWWKTNQAELQSLHLEYDGVAGDAFYERIARTGAAISIDPTLTNRTGFVMGVRDFLLRLTRVQIAVLIEHALLAAETLAELMRRRNFWMIASKKYKSIQTAYSAYTCIRSTYAHLLQFSGEMVKVAHLHGPSGPPFADPVELLGRVHATLIKIPPNATSSESQTDAESMDVLLRVLSMPADQQLQEAKRICGCDTMAESREDDTKVVQLLRDAGAAVKEHTSMLFELSHHAESIGSASGGGASARVDNRLSIVYNAALECQSVYLDYLPRARVAGWTSVTRTHTKDIIFDLFKTWFAAIMKRPHQATRSSASGTEPTQPEEKSGKRAPFTGAEAARPPEERAPGTETDRPREASVPDASAALAAPSPQKVAPVASATHTSPSAQAPSQAVAAPPGKSDMIPARPIIPDDVVQELIRKGKQARLSRLQNGRPAQHAQGPTSTTDAVQRRLDAGNSSRKAREAGTDSPSKRATLAPSAAEGSPIKPMGASPKHPVTQGSKPKDNERTHRATGRDASSSGASAISPRPTVNVVRQTSAAAAAAQHQEQDTDARESKSGDSHTNSRSAVRDEGVRANVRLPLPVINLADGQRDQPPARPTFLRVLTPW